MFSRKEEVQFDKVETLIGKNTQFKGDIFGGGTVRVDGALEGRISTKGDVVVGGSGKVKADIEAKNILIAGLVEGNVNVTGKMEITNTAKISGDLRVGVLSIEEGATLDGNCNMLVGNKTEKEIKQEAAS